MSKLLEKDKILVLHNIPYPNKSKVLNWQYIITVSQSDLNERINFKSYEPSSKDRLFFYPGCDIPRYKVRSWLQSINGSVTIKPENATASFAPKNPFESLVKDGRFVSIPIDVAKEWILENYVETPLDSASNLLEELEKYPLDSIYIDYKREFNLVTHTGYDPTRYYQSYAVGYKKTLHEIMATKTPMSYGALGRITYNDYIEVSELNLIDSLFKGENVYSQESLIRLVNGNSATLDSEMYNNLVNMFKSTNNNDKVTALSVLTSCNLEKSLHYILLLIDEFYDVISRMKETNHVNFKSLVKYIGKPLYNLNSEVQMSVLMEKEVLTYSMLKEYAEGTKDVLNRKSENRYFKIKTIEATQEIKDYFSKRNITQEN